MLTSAVFRNTITSISIIPSKTINPHSKSSSKAKSRFSTFQFRIRATLKPLIHPKSPNQTPEFHDDLGPEKNPIPSVLLNSLRVLEWDKLCDVVSSFAGTSFGRLASKEQLWAIDQTYEESLELLRETNAAVEIHKYNNSLMDFTSIDALLVRTGIDRARRSSPVSGPEALAVAEMLQFAETLQLNIKSAIKDNADLLERFMPLAELILGWEINKSLVRTILRVVDEDGSIKDSSSPKLKQSRWRVLHLESKLNQLMSTLIANETNEVPSLEARNIDGRWCIRSGTDQLTSFQGLLLSSGSGMGNIIEPISAVPLNDELLEARSSVEDAEAEVLLDITEKMKMDLASIELLLKNIVELDVVNARASYGLSMRGNCPDLLLFDKKNIPLHSEGFSPEVKLANFTKKRWMLCLPKAYHPLLLQQYRHNLREAKKDVAVATAELRRRKLYGENVNQQEAKQIDLQMLEEKVAQLENTHPVPVDLLIDESTRVLLITGPNTGGKTICLKSVGLAAIMAKTGLYVLCSEPARIPWFDCVFADIGDEQSLSQSLSTFSGHLRQISDIQAKSTNQSLVLLDEIGAGTNPLEGAALGMSVLESFAEADALLTLATTHHGELKTLKYSNDAFENACVEFDEVNLKPTYKILWGVPGRSNAINIAERLGFPKSILRNARQLYGVASAEVDEVIYELEKFKQDVEEHVYEAHNHLMVSRELHAKVLNVQRKLAVHRSDLSYTKMQQISEYASRARSTLHRKMQLYRASACQIPKPTGTELSVQGEPVNSQKHAVGDNASSSESAIGIPVKESEQMSSGAENRTRLPMVGTVVQIPSLGTKATVLQVESSKEEILVQAGKLKLKLKISDIKM